MEYCTMGEPAIQITEHGSSDTAGADEGNGKGEGVERRMERRRSDQIGRSAKEHYGTGGGQKRRTSCRKQGGKRGMGKSRFDWMEWCHFFNPFP